MVTEATRLPVTVSVCGARLRVQVAHTSRLYLPTGGQLTKVGTLCPLLSGRGYERDALFSRPANHSPARRKGRRGCPGLLKVLQAWRKYRYMFYPDLSRLMTKQDRRENGETSPPWVENWARKGFEGSQEAEDG